MPFQGANPGSIPGRVTKKLLQGVFKNMNILGIETSCDETALSIVEASGPQSKPLFKILATSLYSQVAIHEQYGGVFPNIAKREHAKNLIPLLKNLLQQFEKNQNIVDNKHTEKSNISEENRVHLKELLSREPELFEMFVDYIKTIPKPHIDLIAVTYGPGLEPALWVGINFAKALNYVWGIPILPVNHMYGHVVSVLTHIENTITFPTLSLLISGGHTELVLIESWDTHRVIGETKDDAVGEAFDKVARMLGLPYPGGPHISKLAEAERTKNPTSLEKEYKLPRPMLHSPDYCFSFSGLKTAVLYTIKKIEHMTDVARSRIAREFEDAVTEVLLLKTKRALAEYGAKTLIIGGGVIANNHIRHTFTTLEKDISGIRVYVPEMSLATDNAVMIAIAGYIQYKKEKTCDPAHIIAEGNARL